MHANAKFDCKDRGEMKLAQHKSAVEVDGAVRGLAASGAAEMAKLMRLEARL